jgi:hypothetical protein
MKSIVRKISKLPRTFVLVNNFIVAGFKKPLNIQQSNITIWKLYQNEKGGRESRKHSDVSGETKEIYENFSQDVDSVIRDIQQGPSEYKLGVRSTQLDIKFQANPDLCLLR